MDKGQRKERSAVKGPAGETGQPFEIGRRGTLLQDGPGGHVPKPCAKDLLEFFSRPPKRCRRRRHQAMGEPRKLLAQLSGGPAEHHLDPFLCPEEVGHQAKG